MKKLDDQLNNGDFELFSNSIAAPFESAVKNIAAKVEKDLVTSPLRLTMSYFLGALLGYIATLVICAQCSIGLSPVAWKTASFIHKIPDPWCPIVCGAIFGIAPFMVTLIFFTRFQHRYLLYRMWWLVVTVPIVASLTMALVENSHNMTWTFIWFLAAVATPYIAEGMAAAFLRQPKW